LRRLRSELRVTLYERYDDLLSCPSVCELDYLIFLAETGNVVVDEHFHKFISHIQAIE
jgi:hypothetical protein